MKVKLFVDLKSQLPLIVRDAIQILMAEPRVDPNQTKHVCLDRNAWIYRENDVIHVSCDNTVELAFGNLPFGLTSENISQVEIYDEGASEFPLFGRYNLEATRAVVGQSSSEGLAKWYMILTGKSLVTSLYLYDKIMSHEIKPETYHQEKIK